jgi:hypothetical protein
MIRFLRAQNLIKFKGSDTLQTCMSYSEERDLNL